MTKTGGKRWKHLLPWVVSIGLLLYVFNWATDWDRLKTATDQANLPLFLAFAAADRLAFFVVWSLLQAATLRRFVTHVPVRSVVAIRGGSELLRAISNPLSDAAFFLGLGRLTGGKLEAVLAAALVPGICHLLVLTLQVTVAMPFLEGGFAANRDVFITAGITWTIVLVVAIGVRVSATHPTRVPGAQRVRDWLDRFPIREIRPFFIWFAGLTVLRHSRPRLASLRGEYQLGSARRPNSPALSRIDDSKSGKFRNPRTRMGGPFLRIRIAGFADRIRVRGQLRFSHSQCRDRDRFSETSSRITHRSSPRPQNWRGDSCTPVERSDRRLNRPLQSRLSELESRQVT